MSRIKDRGRVRRVALVWPYLPEYRLAFCQAAVGRLAHHGITLTVYTGRPSADQRLRQDVVTAPWHRTVTQHRLRLPGAKEIVWHALPRDADLLILQQAVKNLESYPALIAQHRSGAGVAFFGHGRSYSSRQGRVLSAWKDLMTRQAEWAFVYTDSGARHLAEHHFPKTRITVLGNTIDVTALQRDVAAVGDEQVTDFHLRHGTVPGRTALFLGALDEAKGIDHVVAVARSAAERLPGCVVVMAGEGPARGMLEAAIAHGAPVRLLGRVTGSEKAVVLRAADVMLVPSAVGLVAVDSLAAQRPLVTVAGALHGPEADYLIDGVNARVLPRGSGVAAMSQAMTDLLVSDNLPHLRDGCRTSAAGLDLDGMVERFVDGVLAWAEIHRFAL